LYENAAKHACCLLYPNPETPYSGLSPEERVKIINIFLKFLHPHVMIIMPDWGQGVLDIVNNTPYKFKTKIVTWVTAGPH